MGFAPGVVAGSLVAYVPARGLAALPMNRPLFRRCCAWERSVAVNHASLTGEVRFLAPARAVHHDVNGLSASNAARHCLRPARPIGRATGFKTRESRFESEAGYAVTAACTLPLLSRL